MVHGKEGSTCADCGEPITGNAAVRGGERFCFDCEPPLHVCAAGSDVGEPQTVEEYEARKRTMIDVSALLEEGDPR